MAERYGVRRLHAFVAVVRMLVEIGREMGVEDRHQPAESRAADEPLEVLSARMVVRTVEAGAGHELDEAVEERLMSDVHPDGHRRLFPVSAEAALPDEDADQEAQVESLRCDSPPPTWSGCYTVW